MNILHISPSLDPKAGGVAAAVKALSFALAERSVNNEIITMDAGDAAYTGDLEIRCHNLAGNHNRWGYSPKLIPWLEHNLSRFDAVIIHGLWLFYGYATMKAIRSIKKNNPGKHLPGVYVMPHGMLDPYFQRAKDRRLKAIRNIIYWRLIERRVINEADGLLFTSEVALRLARETFSGYRPKMEYNLGFGIEPAPVYAKTMHTAFIEHCPGLGESPYLLFLGRIHPKKGLDILVKAYITLYRQRNEQLRLPKLVIAGPGIHTSFAKGVRAELAKHPEVQASVFFTDMLTGDAKWGAFYGCEAFILPSHQENFAIAVVEALACGKPVLISDQVNIWMEVASESAGLIANDNFIGTKKMLQEWIDLTPKEKANLSDRATIAYRKYFTLNKTIERLLRIIGVNDEPKNQ